MVWFLVALSFSVPGDLPSMQAREIGQGPFGMVACDVELEIYNQMGTLPYGFDASVGSDFYCVDTQRLCAMMATPANTAARQAAFAGGRNVQQRYCPATL